MGHLTPGGRWIVKRFLLVLAITAPIGTVSAQFRYRGGFYPFAPIGTATSGEQARAEGLADLIRARGQFEQDHAAAVAAMNAENQLQMERRMNQRQAYREMQSQRAAQIRERNAQNRESLARSQNEMLPRTLPPTQLDPSTGEIKWPALLGQSQFDATRKVVDDLFRNWASANKSGQPFDISPMITAISSMRDQLRQLISSVDTMTYLGARGFLDSLEMSARRTGAG